MSIDFTQVLQQAAAATQNSGTNGENKQYPYTLVYPQPGATIVLRPLFNPASGQIVRLVHRHEKVACYRTYGVECPICKTMKSVKDMTGQDPFGRKKASKSRGLCFAQFISSTTPVRKGTDANSPIVQPGETILFMFPWSVYQQINAIIQAIGQTPTGMDQAFCHAQSGCYIQVNVSNDGKFTYTTTQVPYMTFPTDKTDEQFLKDLEGMPSLNEQVLPPTITEEVAKQVTEYEQEIYKTYVSPRVPNAAPVTGQMPQSITQQFTGYQPPVAPPATATPSTIPVVPPTATTSDMNAGHPECYGKHQENSPQCICCPDEINCQEETTLPF